MAFESLVYTPVIAQADQSARSVFCLIHQAHPSPRRRQIASHDTARKNGGVWQAGAMERDVLSVIKSGDFPQILDGRDPLSGIDS